MRRLICSAAVAASVVASGCAGSDSEGAGGPLRLGVSTPVDGGTVAIGPVVDVGSDETGPWAVVTVTAAAGNDPVSNIQQIAIQCAGGELGEALASGTFDTGETVPGGQTRTGTMLLLLPGDDRTGQPVPECGEPAAVVLVVNGFRDTSVSWSLEARTVEVLNTLAAHVGIPSP